MICVWPIFGDTLAKDAVIALQHTIWCTHITPSHCTYMTLYYFMFCIPHNTVHCVVIVSQHTYGVPYAPLSHCTYITLYFIIFRIPYNNVHWCCDCIATYKWCTTCSTVTLYIYHIVFHYIYIYMVQHMLHDHIVLISHCITVYSASLRTMCNVLYLQSHSTQSHPTLYHIVLHYIYIYGVTHAALSHCTYITLCHIVFRMLYRVLHHMYICGVWWDADHDVIQCDIWCNTMWYIHCTYITLYHSIFRIPYNNVQCVVFTITFYTIPSILYHIVLH